MNPILFSPLLLKILLTQEIGLSLSEKQQNRNDPGRGPDRIPGVQHLLSKVEG